MMRALKLFFSGMILSGSIRNGETLLIVAASILLAISIIEEILVIRSRFMAIEQSKQEER